MVISIKKTNDYITFFTFLGTIFLTVFGQVVIGSFFLMVICVGILCMSFLYKWNFHVLINSGQNHLVKFGYLSNYVRKAFIVLSLTTIIITVVINELNLHYPTWENTYISTRYSKNLEIEDHQPLEIPIDSLRPFPGLRNQTESLITCRNKSHIYFYKSATISNEMIDDILSDYDKYGIGIVVIGLICLLIIMAFDFTWGGFCVKNTESRE